MTASDESSLFGVLPWTRSCFVCGEENPHGLKLRSRVEGGRVKLEYTPREADLGYRYIVHGGISMTLLDEVMTWAAILAVRKVCVAADFSVRLRGPIQVGEALRVEGWAERVSSRLVVTSGRILGPDGAERLTAQGKYMPMPEDQVELTAKDFVIDPGAIHPDDIIGG